LVFVPTLVGHQSSDWQLTNPAVNIKRKSGSLYRFLIFISIKDLLFLWEKDSALTHNEQQFCTTLS
jgi:hypothetical protein